MQTESIVNKIQETLGCVFMCLISDSQNATCHNYLCILMTLVSLFSKEILIGDRKTRRHTNE